MYFKRTIGEKITDVESYKTKQYIVKPQNKYLFVVFRTLLQREIVRFYDQNQK